MYGYLRSITWEPDADTVATQGEMETQTGTIIIDQVVYILWWKRVHWLRHQAQFSLIRLHVHGYAGLEGLNDFHDWNQL